MRRGVLSPELYSVRLGILIPDNGCMYVCCVEKKWLIWGGGGGGGGGECYRFISGEVR